MSSNSSSDLQQQQQQHEQHITRPGSRIRAGRSMREQVLLAEGPDRALLLLNRLNPVRRLAAVLVTNMYFEWLILSLILANCVTLAMCSHQPGFDNTQLGQTLGYMDYVFAACFSLELLLKVLAMGLVLQPGTYLRDGWNILDAAVVLLGWLDIALSGSAYTFLRTVRALRPLRTVTHIKGLKVPVATLVKALPMLLDVLVLCLFAFFIFGIVAVQLFAGALRNSCAVADFTYAYVASAATGSDAPQTYANVSYLQPGEGSVQQCSGYFATDISWTLQQDGASSTGVPVWSGGSPGGGWACPTQLQQPDAPFGTFCAALGNPNNGMTSFDNIVWAWVTIFQCITTEGWTDIMYALQDAVSPWVLVYFVLLIIFGSFFLVNLALAVLYLQFTKEFSVSAAASRLVSTAASAAVTRCCSFATHRVTRTQQLPPKLLEEHVQHVLQSKNEVGKSCSVVEEHCSPCHEQQHWQQVAVQQDQPQHVATVMGPTCAGQQTAQQLQACRTPPSCGELSLDEMPSSCCNVQAGAELPPTPTSAGRLPPLANGVAWGLLTDGDGEPLEQDGLPGSLPGNVVEQGMLQSGSVHGDVTARVIISRRTASMKGLQQGKQQTAAGSGSSCSHQQSPRTILKHDAQMQRQMPQVQAQPQQPARELRRVWPTWLQNCWRPIAQAWELLGRKCRDLIKTGWVEIVSLIVIVTNTAVMASASYPGNPQWQAASDILNVVFCCYFVLELLIKLLASGFRAFARDKMNIFDTLVVAASLVEVVMFLLPGDETSSNSLSVLRTARLLRVFKLARSWTELNRIITTILKSFSQVMYLSVLLMLFVFVFGLMGMQLFGYKFGSCSIPGSQQLCPPSTPLSDCPAYPDCYVACQETQGFSWINVTGSPYNNMAYCERFPRNASFLDNATVAAIGGFQYWAQVGKASVPDSRFDNIGWAVITVFQVITTENWNNVAYSAMAATSPAAYLWFVTIIVLGNYILLNLFLAILLDNFGSSSGSSGGSSSANSAGGTLAAAARAAQLLAWMQELLEASWFAKMVQRKNRVANAPDGCAGQVGIATAPEPDDEQAPISGKPVGLVRLLDDSEASSNSCAAPRGRAFLLGDSSCSEHAPGQIGAPEGKANTGGTSAASAARRRSFMPLVAPSKSSDNLQALAGSRQCSFLAARTQSVTGRVPLGATSVSRSAKSCTVAGVGCTDPDLCSTGQAEAVPGPFGSRGAISSRRTGSISGHRLASMMSQRQAVPVVQEEQQATCNWQDLQEDSNQQCSEQVPGVEQQAATKAERCCHTSVEEAAARALQACAQLDDLQDLPGRQPPPEHALKRPLSGQSCCCLAPDSWLRLQLNKLLCSPYFENTILALIFASSIALALDMPSLDPFGPFKKALEALDCIFAILFLFEAVVKILVHGFVFNGPGSYLRNPWNVLDFAIVIIGMIVMSTTLAGLHRAQSLSSLKALRTLRALRPLRVASRLEGMKVVVNSLFASLPALGNVLLVCLLFYLIFGIMAVDLLGGSLYACQDPTGQLYDADFMLPAGQYITRDWCLNDSLQVTSSAYHSIINVTIPPYTPQREWVKPVANYDNIMLATFTLWQISTTELWVNTMYTAISAVGVDQQPRDGYNPVLALFFIAFIVFGGFFVLQLFVSVTIEKFSEMHQQQGKSALLTQQQEDWLKIERMMAEIDLQVKHTRPRHWLRAAMFQVVQSRQAEMVVMAAILANCIVMAMTHADMDNGWQDFMTYANLGFTAFFALEILARLVALGLKPVFRDPWSRFDILVVAVSIVGVAVDLGTPSNLEFLPLLRVLRVVRIFRLVPKAEGLKVLLRTLTMSLPALGNIVSVLGLFFFIYAVIGMNLWGTVKHGQYLTRHANFDHLGMALLTQFRMITGETWDGIMQDCMLTSMCVEVLQDVALSNDTSRDGGSTITAGTWLDPGDARLLSGIPADAVANRCSPSPIAAVFFFCSFVLLCGLVLVNFVIGVIIDNFQNSCQTDDLPISKSSVDHFVQVWSDLDPQATHFIPAIQLGTLIQELLPPMGVKGEAGARAKIQGIIMGVDIPVRSGKIHFLETMHALAGRIAGTEVPDDEEQKVRSMLYPRLPYKDASDLPKYGVSHFYAALYVQAAVRGFLRRHALNEGCSVHSSIMGSSASGVQQRRRRSSQWQWLFPAPEPALPPAAAIPLQRQQTGDHPDQAPQNATEHAT